MRVGLSLFVVVVFIATIVAGNLDISFSRNVTGSVSSSDWEYRSTSLSSWDLSPLIGCGVSYSSLSVGGKNRSVDANSLWGAASVVTEGFPLSYLAYWDLEVTFGDGTNWGSVDVSGSAGFIAHSYVALVEKDTTGKIVASASLEQGIPYLGDLSYELTDNGNTASGLKWNTFHGVHDDGWTIDITYVLSDVVGVIGYGDAYVGPKSLESIINIQGWKYKNTAKTLSLVMGVASGDITVSGNTILSQANTANQVYFRAAEKATVDGTSKSVTVNYAATTDYSQYFNDGNIQAQLTAATKGSYTLQVATVTFPAGSNNIVYDPSVGAGQPVQDHSSAVRIAGGNFFAIFVAFLVCVVLKM